jgi:hypothetical protein
MITVWNTKTLEESVYSIEPEFAVIAAHEQSIRNNNTWAYRNPENHPLYRKTRKGHYCGDFWSKDK